MILNEAELNVIKGLLHYLNSNMSDSPVKPDTVLLVDSNGESAGTIVWTDGDYQFSWDGTK